MAVGGDGTIAAVAHGLRGTNVVLGVLPRGTFNNIAASLDIPEDPDRAVEGGNSKVLLGPRCITECRGV